MRRPYATGPPADPEPDERTTTASSAKNHAVAALTTKTPINGDHHGCNQSS